MSPFVRPRPVANPAARLVVFHHAAGSAGAYYPMSATIPSDWDLLLLDLPGRGKRFGERPIDAMADLVARVIEDVHPWVDAPLALFGHSLGAIVASEVGRACEAMGAPPIWIGVSGRIAPALPQVRRSLHEFNDAALLEELLALGGTPQRLGDSPEFLQLFLRNARADLAAVESYEPETTRAQCACAITAFAGTKDPWAPPNVMEAWEQETTGSFRLRQFDGGHFYFFGAAFAALTRAIVADVEYSGVRATPTHSPLAASAP